MTINIDQFGFYVVSFRGHVAIDSSCRRAMANAMNAYRQSKMQ